MNIAMIADDLTGANDSGVQLAKCGFRTSVLLRRDTEAAREQEAVVLNTDSRSLSREEAYRRVKEAATFLQLFSPELVYKKMDSTLRGQIGAELDAVYDVFRPDLVIIAPALPKNGRRIVNGWHYVHDRLLHETEVARDPKTPVTESYVPRLIQAQTSRAVELLTCETLHAGPEAAAARLRAMREAGVPYVVFDSDNDDDLRRIVQAVGRTGYRVVWSGSAGLAHYASLSLTRPLSPKEPLVGTSGRPLLIVVGSVSERSRQQLKELLSQPDTAGVAVQAERLVMDDAGREREIARACEAALQFAACGKHPALYSTGGEADIMQAITAGEARGMTQTQVGDAIAAALGEAAERFIARFTPGGLVLTGGDTAGHVSSRLGAERFELTDELESGVPIGRLISRDRAFVTVTKAGSFGTDRVLVNAVERLQGGIR